MRGSVSYNINLLGKKLALELLTQLEGGAR